MKKIRIREILINKKDKSFKFFDARDTLSINQISENKFSIKPLFKMSKFIDKGTFEDLMKEVISESTLEKDNKTSPLAEIYKAFFNEFKSRTDADEYALIIHSDDESYDNFYERFYNSKLPVRQ